MKGFKKWLIKFLATHGYGAEIALHVADTLLIKYKDNMQYAFTDDKGRQYFTFTDTFKMPLAMVEKLNDLQGQMAAKIPGRDLDAWAESFAKDIMDIKDGAKLKARVGWWIEGLKERRSVTMDPTLLMEIAALTYVREDENPAIYNEAIHREKFEMLWKDSREGARLYDFFQASGLKAFMPSIGVTGENWMTFFRNDMEKIRQFNSNLLAISTFASFCEKEMKTA